MMKRIWNIIGCILEREREREREKYFISSQIL